MKKLVLLFLVTVFVALGLCACEPVRQVDTTTSADSTSGTTSTTRPAGTTSSQLPTGSHETPKHVTYVLNGGEQNVGNTSFYVPGTEFKLQAPAKYGHVFEGWYDNANFQGSPVTSLKNFSGDITLYARWSLVVVKVKYNMGANVVDPVNNSDNPASFEWSADGDVLELYDPVANGYSFMGWYSSADLSEESKITSISRDTLQTVNVYAKWEKAPSLDITEPLSSLPQHQGLKLPAGSQLIIDVEKQTTQSFATMPNGQKAMLYAGANTGVLRVTTSTLDITEYSAITFMMYNANPHGGTLIWWYLDTSGRGNVYTLPLNWTGWKQVTFTIGSPEWGFQGGANLTQVKDFRWQANGWSGNLDAKDEEGNYKYNTISYIDDVYLVGNDSPYKLDTSTLTSADYKAVKDNWREYLVGNSSITPESTGKSRGQTAIGHANSMNTSANRTYLWSNLTDLTSETGVENNFKRVKDMALGWGTPGSAYYHDAGLLASIVDALTFLNTYDVDDDGIPGVYGENMKKSRPGNWWNWEIGTPTELVDALMIIEEAVTMDFLKQILVPVDYLCYPIGMTAANRTWIAQPAIGSILLQEDGTRIVPAMQQLLDVFNYVNSSDGFYEDGSFIQHKDISYIHGYGGSFFGSITNELYFIQGTPFDITLDDGKKFSQVYSDKILQFFFDSVEPLVYDGYAIFGSSGRNMSTGTARGIVSNVFVLSEFASESMRERFYSTLKYYENVDNSTYGNLSGNLPWVSRAYYDVYRARTDITARSDYYFSQVFGGMDRTVSHGETFSAVVCMSSTRIERFEAINGAGSKGWYIGDGSLFIYGSTQGNYNSDYFSGLDWLMLPGTTVSSFNRVQQQYTADTNLKNGSDFVGGAFYGRYAVSVMYLKYNEYDDIQGLTSDLRAQKSYFFFNGEIVCVGSGITASNDEVFNVGEVYTVVGNHAINKAAASYYQIKVNGNAISTSSNANLHTGVDYITVEAFGGYYFPGGEDVNIRHQGTNSDRYAQIYVNHGAAPQYEKYAYVILPEYSEEEVAQYAANPDVEVITSTNFVTVVREISTNTTGYVFWYGTYAAGIRSSGSAVIVKVDNGDGSFTFSVSDPSQKLPVISLTLDGEWEITGDKVTGTAIQNGNTIVNVNANEAYGASLVFTARPKN